MPIIVLALVGIGAAAGYSIASKPLYNATSKVFVSTQGGISVSDLAQGNSFTTQRVKSYAQLAVTPIVLIPVIEKLKLDTTADDLMKRVAAEATLDTSIIDITVTDTNNVRAANTANAISSSLATVVASIETSDSTTAANPVKLTSVQDAEPPLAPISPRVALNIALGALVGLALGFGFALLRENLDTRVRTESDIEGISDIPVLGRIVFDPKASERPLIVQADSKSSQAESFRTLRTNLQFLDADRTNRSFVITSAIEGEGKSTTAANLAIALADTGVQVLLVEADLRRPKLAEYMGVEGSVGLSDALIGRVDLKDVIQPWGSKSLHFLPAGAVPPNPSELLGSARMDSLIDQFNQEFEVVIFDSPPVLPVTDASILSKKIGSTIVIVATGRTHKGQLKGALTLLENVGAPISGIVLTMLPVNGRGTAGYGQYGSSYNYVERSEKHEAKPAAERVELPAARTRTKPPLKVT